MVKVLIYALPVILAVWAIVDYSQTRGADVRRLPKPLWLVVIVLVPVIGPVCWLTLGRRRGAPPLQPPPPPRPVAPDDDPDFLRRLEIERMQAERERQRREKESQPEADDEPA